jgi:hypothetical protein
MAGVTHHWVPHTCLIPAYSADELQQALHNRTLFYIGDSTMHETMRYMLQLMGFGIEECRNRHKCVADGDRIFDSHDGYSTRCVHSRAFPNYAGKLRTYRWLYLSAYWLQIRLHVGGPFESQPKS